MILENSEYQITEDGILIKDTFDTALIFTEGEQ